MNKKTNIEKVEVMGDKLRIVAVMDITELQEEFIPYYELKQDIRRAIAPVMIEEILKNKDEIIKEVLREVNWPEIVRSEIAQRVIAEAGKPRY